MITSRPKPPALLPINSKRAALLYSVEKCQITVLSAPTGSGKSTQIPQYLYQTGWCADNKQVVVCQPSKSAVIGTALHVADQMNCEVGQEVGYCIRWRNMTSTNTRIKYITDDLLLREIQLDPLLQQYSVVMLDDAHERTLSTDLLCALLKRICKKRVDLKVIVSGATAAALMLVKYFNAVDAASASTEAHTVPSDPLSRYLSIEDSSCRVDIQRRVEPVKDYLDFVIETTFDIISSDEPGDILVFLTGRAQVYEAIGAVQMRIMDFKDSAPDLRLLPLHHNLGRDQQRDLFEEVASTARRIIFTDSVAETGITLDGIAFVVDCGFTKVRMYDWKSGVDCLVQAPISKLSSALRARQAGVGGTGKCFQAYTTADYDAFPEFDLPEIRRTSFSAALLLLKNLGIANPFKFGFVTPPTDELLLDAAEYLLAMSAIDEDFKMTRLGVQLADMPVCLQMAKSLLSAPRHGCTKEMLSIAAMVDTGLSPWAADSKDEDDFAPNQRLFGVRESDHLTLLNVYLSYADPQIGKKNRQWCEKHSISYQTLAMADKIRPQLERYLQKYSINTEQSLLQPRGKTMPEEKEKVGDSIRKCLLSGYFAHVATRQTDGSFQMVRGGRVVHAHKGSFASRYTNNYILFGSVLEHEFKQTEILEITKIERGWLPEAAPLLFRLQSS